MKIVKLGPMRLKLNETSELAKSSTRLPAIGEVYSEYFNSVLHSNLLTWQERRGPFEVLKQRGRETVGKVKPSVVNQEDSIRVKLECGQESDITSYHR
ncbi:hypothetical protein Goshw_026374, partial [Gossypium schwendimanii]|nr:hypothetical protein [Gossypium schwendimanii]